MPRRNRSMKGCLATVDQRAVPHHEPKPSKRNRKTFKVTRQPFSHWDSTSSVSMAVDAEESALTRASNATDSTLSSTLNSPKQAAARLPADFSDVSDSESSSESDSKPVVKKKRKPTQEAITPWPNDQTHALAVPELVRLPASEIYSVLRSRLQYREFAIAKGIWHGCGVDKAPYLYKCRMDAARLCKYLTKLGRPRDQSREMLYEQTKKEKRIFRNRQAAKKCRARKEQELRDLRGRNAQLQVENTNLQTELSQLKASIHQLNSENAKMKKSLSDEDDTFVPSSSAGLYFDDDHLLQLRHSRPSTPLEPTGAAFGQTLECSSISPRELHGSPDLLGSPLPLHLSGFAEEENYPSASYFGHICDSIERPEIYT